MADNLASRLSRMSLNTIQLARVRLQPSACVTVLTEQLTGNDEVMPASTEMARLVEESYQAEGLARVRASEQRASRESVGSLERLSDT